mmetsp:Transcript_17692/g.15964  ORF Transcript_17692/g.15964 Transcript_17692/m.15964 type:complete len:125 (+) Transcript_17692:78-452(+)
MFGSSNFTTQPRNIRSSFILRSNLYLNVTKHIINTINTLELNIHYHVFVENKTFIIQPNDLALNHYAIMSLEYFQSVKMTRGDVSSKAYYKIRDINYFNSYDKLGSGFIDNELKDLVISSNQLL